MFLPGVHHLYYLLDSLLRIQPKRLTFRQRICQCRVFAMSVFKVFDNGVTMSAFATKTDVSAAQFGEGSFNKGVTWSVPFDALMVSSRRTTAVFNWSPLTREGEAKLNRPLQLIAGTSLLDPRTLTQKPANRPDEQLIPDDLGR